MDRYTTIDRAVGDGAEAEVVVLRSRFLARVRRVESEQDARAFVAEVRADHHDARHHCTAFVIGADASLRRSNDAGEPSGTAGRPMLEVVTGRELSDVAVVVTRWFGGTLLGTGGLARAYADATASALDAAGTRQRRRWQQARVIAPMTRVGELERRLHRDTEVLDASYGADDVVYTVAFTDPAVLDRLDHEPLEPIWVDVQ